MELHPQQANGALLNNLLAKALRKADELLEDSGEMGPSDRAKAILTARDIHDYAKKDEVREHVRRACLEASRYLSGGYEGQEEVNLGSWAEGCSDEEALREKAEAVLYANRSVFS